MSETKRASNVSKTTPVGFITLSVVFWVIACALAAGAVILLDRLTFETQMLEIAVTYLAFAPATLMTLLSAVFMLVGGTRWAIFGRDARDNTFADLARHAKLLESINKRLLLSDTAKKIAYRSEDIAVLRQTIEEDIRTHQFDAAMVLVSDLAEVYGQLEESERYRDEIDHARTEDLEAKVKAGLEKFAGLLESHEYVAANKEAARLRRLYPQSHQLDHLDQRVTQAREQYKQDLEREFLKAAEREEVDRAIELLKTLDGYLTLEEAEPFREVARGVIGKKRDNLGVQFKMAVHDREWTAAVWAGEQIIREFPNTRMADEVRSMIDLLRERSAGQKQANAAHA